MEYSEKNPPNKLQVRWKVTMPFEVVCKQCVIVDYKSIKYEGNPTRPLCDVRK